MKWKCIAKKRMHFKEDPQYSTTTKSDAYEKIIIADDSGYGNTRDH